ncbi:MAG: WhiB family transcriptional regulator [Actinomycetota bacterium]|jgi:WhiB family redox-sensing transcriptional regulator|nr:WhiB family transcriptional regulator [Actinomycetota bacterium]
MSLIDLILHDDTNDAAWRSEGRCVDGAATMTGLFFSEDLYDIARAKAICAKCPMTTECLDHAVRIGEPWGVWGGELIMNGKILANKRGRGRPPKIPRPELIVDEVPVPPYLLPSKREQHELVKTA